MNDDRFMESLRREPPRELARSLWSRLTQSHAAEDPAPRRHPLVPALATALAVVAVATAFLFPSVRASAQAFLDLFRVQNFVAVRVDPSRIERLDEASLDLKRLIGERTQVLQEPGPARVFPSAAAAAATVGMIARTPAWLPTGMVADSVWLNGEARVRVTADGQRLRELMDLLDIRDLTVPRALDGAVVEVHAYPAVRQTFRSASGKTRVMLMQAKSPEVSLPAGVELARVAEIGLRMLGMSSSEARSLADRTDWRTTLLVPVPTGSATFQEIGVDGGRGLLMVPSGREGRSRTMLLWSRQGEVYALGGGIDRTDLVQIAESLR